MTGIGAYLRGELRDHAHAQLITLLDELPEKVFSDIAIRPFRVRCDDVTFGLIDESNDERGDWAELHPDCLGFGPPWDGLYST